jgi:hypothetical protein
MDPKRAKELIREYCDEKDAQSPGSSTLKRMLRPIGLGLALGAMSLTGGACSDDSGPGPQPNDAYGISGDIAQTADAYGISSDLPPSPDIPQVGDAYGINGDMLPMDTAPPVGDAYGIPDINRD